jgi:hypothetical protein
MSFNVFYLAVSVVLVLIAGLMSGLTLGLMSLDSVDVEVRGSVLPYFPFVPSQSHSPGDNALSLAKYCFASSLPQVLKRSGTAKEQKYAKKIAQARNSGWQLDSSTSYFSLSCRNFEPYSLTPYDRRSPAGVWPIMHEARQ